MRMGAALGSTEATPAETAFALFSGPFSLRVPRERLTLVLSLLAAPLAVALVGLFFHGVTVSEVVLVVVVGLVLVSLARGRLLGNSVRVGPRQFPEVFADVDDIAARLGVAVPHVFVRDDPVVPVVSIGTEEPYALVFSSQYFEHLRPGELRFLIARELGHIAAGHTRIASLFSASGRENPFVSLVFGAWLRKTEYTADRIGFIAGASLADAISAIAITTFHSVGRGIDYEALAEQSRDFERDARLRLGEWSAPAPFATNRIAALRVFETSPLARHWRSLGAARQTAAPVRTATRGSTVTRADCAGPLRRLAAISIDSLVVSAILQSGLALKFQVSGSPRQSEARLPWFPQLQEWLAQHHVHVSPYDPSGILGFLLYSAILVAIGGQTLGMMIVELRVVTRAFDNPSIGRTLWRYAAATLCVMAVVPALAGLLLRIQPHDWLSGTRVIRNRLLR